MRHRRRNAYSSYYGSRGGSRGPADWLGLLALVCICLLYTSLVLVLSYGGNIRGTLMLLK